MSYEAKAHVGLAIGLILLTVVPSAPASAQQTHSRLPFAEQPWHLTTGALGPHWVKPATKREWLLFPGLEPSHHLSQRGSRMKYMLWGAGVGGAVGLAVGWASYNNSRCTDCWVPNEVIPVYGFILGVSAGGLLGLLVHAMTPDTASARDR